MREHAVHRVVDGAAETAALRRDIDEGDGSFFHANMLVHDLFDLFLDSVGERST
jgi:hypothetical protein